MKVGPASVINLNEKAVNFLDEQSLVLAYAYGLAFEDYLKNSLKQKLFRFIHYGQPKKIVVIAKLSYEFKVVPFRSNEFFIHDSYNNYVEKLKTIAIDPLTLESLTENISISVNTLIEETSFIKSLKNAKYNIDTFKKNSFSTSFLRADSPVINEIINQLHPSEVVQNLTPVVRGNDDQTFEPENCCTNLNSLLENSNRFVTALEQARNRISGSSQQMITKIESKYPVGQHSIKTNINFGWKNTVNSDKCKNILSIAEELITQLKSEIKPAIEKIEREKRIEISQFEQNAKIMNKEIERIFDTEKSNFESRILLELKNFDLSKKAYENQIESLEEEYDEIDNSYQMAQEEYERAIISDSVGEPIGLTQNIAQLRRTKDSLSDKIRDTKRALKSIKNNINDTKERLATGLERIDKNKEQKLHENNEKLEINIATVHDALNKEISEKSAHISTIEQEKKLLEDIINTSIQQESKDFQISETLEIDPFWNDSSLLNLKTEAIQNLQTDSVKGIDDALLTINHAKQFLNNHLIRINTLSSVTIDILFPFWYIELQSDKATEIHIIPSSDVTLYKIDDKSKAVSGIHFVPRLPAIASILDSIKNNENIRKIAYENNIANQLCVDELLSPNHWIIKGKHIKEDLNRKIQEEKKNKNRKYR